MIGKRYGLDKNELMKHAGTVKQFCGIEKVRYTEGKAKDVDALFFRTGTGFNFTVLADRCMDIYHAENNGAPLVYYTQAGIQSPQYYDNKGWSWVKTFGGGLLQTCGLLNIGPGCVHEGEEFGAHGAISAAPAENVCVSEFWEGENFILEAKGTMREERMNKYNFKLERTIRVIAGEKKIYLKDRVTNEAYKPSPMMVMYHINFGYPLLSENARLCSSLKQLLPRDPDAADGKEQYNVFEKPKANCNEKCYFHIMNEDPSGKASAGLFNTEFEGGIGVVLEWNRKNLPRMTEWKMLGNGLYVCGMEPANCWGNSVVNEIKTPDYKPMEPGESKDFEISISIVESKSSIDAAIKKIESMAAKNIEYIEPIVKERSKSV